MNNPILLYLLLNKLEFYQHLIDKILYYFIDIHRVILNNQIINLNTQSVQLCYNSYTDNNLFLLFIALKYSPFTKLWLNNNKIASIHLLFKKIKDSKITQLSLCNNLITDSNPLRFLHNSNLKELWITNNDILDIDPFIKLILNSKLKKLNIANNKNLVIDKLIDNIQFSYLEYLFVSSSSYKHKSPVNVINKNNKKCYIVIFINYDNRHMK
jgi:hypothetical protein